MKKIKKILTGTLISAISVTAIGCGTTNSKLAKNIDKSMANFVASINNLDYVDTTKPTNSDVNKVSETNTKPYAINSKRLDGNQKVTSNKDSMSYLNDKLSENEIENTITRPTERCGDFSLFILSDVPFVTLTSEDNKTNMTFNFKFSTDKIEETSTEIDSKINTLILKRSILMIYVNEIYNNNVNFSEENKVAINAYLNVIRENTSFLNGNRGMVKNQLSLASDLVHDESNDDLVNYYIIKSSEALETRASKLESTISAIDSIINIIENNLATSSSYYNVKLSGAYDNIISNLKTDNTSTEINNNSTNKDIADSILNSLELTEKSFLENKSSIQVENKNNENNEVKLENNENKNANLTKNINNIENITKTTQNSENKNLMTNKIELINSEKINSSNNNIADANTLTSTNNSVTNNQENFQTRINNSNTWKPTTNQTINNNQSNDINSSNYIPEETNNDSKNEQNLNISRRVETRNNTDNSLNTKTEDTISKTNNNVLSNTNNDVLNDSNRSRRSRKNRFLNNNSSEYQTNNYNTENKTLNSNENTKNFNSTQNTNTLNDSNNTVTNPSKLQTNNQISKTTRTSRHPSKRLQQTTHEFNENDENIDSTRLKIKDSPLYSSSSSSVVSENKAVRVPYKNTANIRR